MVLAEVGRLPLVASLILLAVFWFDASYTLCVRIVTRQRFTEAHRSHCYQKLSDRLGHGPTSLMLWIFSLLWLLPIAAASQAFPDFAYALLGLACVPLLISCVITGAGVQQSAEPAVGTH